MAEARRKEQTAVRYEEWGAVCVRWIVGEMEGQGCCYRTADVHGSHDGPERSSPADAR
jgi:hypothetical protein